MASTPILRNDTVSSRPTTNPSNNPRPTLAELGTRFLANAAQPGPQPQAPRRLVLPTRYMELEPPRPLSAINDDPVFNAGAAASILGVTVECLKKWRQRGQGPDYIQYGDNGPVRYALSALMAYRAARTVHSGEKK